MKNIKRTISPVRETTTVEHRIVYMVEVDEHKFACEVQEVERTVRRTDELGRVSAHKTSYWSKTNRRMPGEPRRARRRKGDDTAYDDLESLLRAEVLRRLPEADAARRIELQRADGLPF